MELKSVLRKIIREKSLTITGVARATKVPLQTLHGWLNGSEPKSIRQLKVVADYLEVDLDHLCFGPKPLKTKNELREHQDEINAGIFEVVLRRVKR